MAKVAIPLAEGFEELEAAAIIDILRRAEIEVFTIGMNSSSVEGAHKITFAVDCKLSDVVLENFDAVVLPGGDPGYKNLMKSSRFMEDIVRCNAKGKIIGAICAAPMVLAKAGMLEDKRATIYPTMETYIPKPRSAPIVIDKNIITGRAPSDAIEFSLRLVEILSGKEKANNVRNKIIINGE